jgi:uncharacterized protein (DUF169 family)
MPIALELLDRLSSLGLSTSPVAIAFVDSPPAEVPHTERPEPAGCGFWRQAGEGRTFYTTADDHTGCPVGAFTHGVALSAEKARELNGMIGTMIELKYIKREEVPALPHRFQPMQLAVYAPLERAPFAPDAVIFRGNVRQIMLVSEAARAAGVFDAGSIMGRPACAMLPQAFGTATAVASVGCIGNRVYTGLGDDEMYLTVPGSAIVALLERLPDTVNANAELEKFHQQRAHAH